jgi:general secretion pathway protein A
MASGTQAEFFTDAALREVHRRSGGVPRLVNLICDRSLLAGYAAGLNPVGPAVVSRAAREILGPKRRRLLASRWPGGRAVVAAVALVGLVVVGALAWQRLEPRHAPALAERADAALPLAAPEPPAPRAEVEPVDTVSAAVGEPG